MAVKQTIEEVYDISNSDLFNFFQDYYVAVKAIDVTYGLRELMQTFYDGHGLPNIKLEPVDFSVLGVFNGDGGEAIVNVSVKVLDLEQEAMEITIDGERFTQELYFSVV